MDNGKFAHACGCVMHQEWSDESLFIVNNIKTSKKYSKKVVVEMRNNLLITQDCQLLCTACYSHFKATRLVATVSIN